MHGRSAAQCSTTAALVRLQVIEARSSNVADSTTPESSMNKQR
jgi:hypothetical protein